MRLWYSNLADVSTVVITASSSASSSLGGSNVAHDHKKKLWRTGTSTALEAIVFDLITAQAITSAGIFYHTLTASDTLIKVQGNATDSWGAPSFSQTFTHSTGPMFETFASQSFRYWRITFTKSAAGESRDIGRIFLGTYIDTAEQPDYDGYERDIVDLSIKQYSIDGQCYSDTRSKYRTLDLDFSGIPQTMKDQLSTFMDSVGEAKSFFAQVDTGATAPTELREILYCKNDKLTSFKVDGCDDATAMRWKFKLELRENL